MLFLVLGLSNIDDADAAHLTINCLTSALGGSEIYVVTQFGFLNKIEQSDGHSCVVGKMVTALSAPAGAGGVHRSRTGAAPPPPLRPGAGYQLPRFLLALPGGGQRQPRSVQGAAEAGGRREVGPGLHPGLMGMSTPDRM